MTVSSAANRLQYTGNAIATVFTAPSLLDETHIDVYVAGVLQMLTTHYTVSGVGGASASVTFVTAPGSGVSVTLARNVPLSQTEDYVENDPFPADTHERALDKLTMIEQQQQDEIGRCLKFDVTSPSSLVPVLTEIPIDGYGLVWDGVSGRLRNTTSSLADLEDYGATIAGSLADVVTVATNIADVTECADNISSIVAAPTEAANAAASAIAALASETAAAISETNAGVSATNASASAAAAASSAAEGLYNNAVTLTSADSPYAPALGEEGTLFRLDMTSGAITINLSALSTYAEDMKYGFVKVDAGGNSATINRGGTDTISGGTSLSLSTQFETHVIVGDSATGTWIDTVQTTGVADNSVTNAKLADVATATIKGRATAGTGDPEDLTPTQVRSVIDVYSTGETYSQAEVDALIGSEPKLVAAALFNGTGTVALINSYNVSSVDDNGTGIYNLNFTSALPSANYYAVITASGKAAGTFRCVVGVTSYLNAPTTTDLEIMLANDSNGFIDVDRVSVLVYL